MKWITIKSENDNPKEMHEYNEDCINTTMKLISESLPKEEVNEDELWDDVLDSTNVHEFYRDVLIKNLKSKYSITRK